MAQCRLYYSEYGGRQYLLVADHFSIVIRFAGIWYEWYMAMRYKFKLVTYVQGPLVIDRRSGTERNLNELMAGSR